MERKNLILYYSLSGRTKKVAECIKENTKGDIEEIILKKPYSKLSSYTKGLVDIKTNKNIEITNQIDIAKYDTIFLGAPIWYFTLNPVIASFLENNNFEGKNIYPFCTDEGACGNYLKKVKELAKGANVFEGLEVAFVNSKTNEELDKIIKEWIKKNNSSTN